MGRCQAPPGTRHRGDVTSCRLSQYIYLWLLAVRGVYRIGEFVEQVALFPRLELVADLLAVVYAFSWRLDGLRPFEEELDRVNLTGAGQR